MIDLHSHILAGLDDGASTLEDSIALAKAFVANGISHAVCTPHIHFGRYDNNLKSISQAFAELKTTLHEQNIGLNICYAAEVRFDIEIMQALENNEIPFVGDWHNQKVLLLELPHGEFPIGAAKLTQWLIDQNIRPMIAHPERNKGIQAKPDKLTPLIEQGCLMQLTAASVTGDFGNRAENLALELIKQRKATVIATDAHHIKRRPPMLREAYKRVCKLEGEALAKQLTIEAPWEIAKVNFER